MEKVVLATKGLYPNVDFFAASVYHSLGIPTDLFTPVFAVSRMAGWTAHVMEQHADNRLIRPDSEYIGEQSLSRIPARPSAGLGRRVRQTGAHPGRAERAGRRRPRAR